MKSARQPRIIIAIPAARPTPAPILLMEETVDIGELVAAGGAVVRVGPAVFDSGHEGSLDVVDREMSFAVLVIDGCELEIDDCEVVVDDCEVVVDDCEVVVNACEVVVDDCEVVVGDCELMTVDCEAIAEGDMAVKPPGITTPRVLYVPKVMMLSVCVQQPSSPPQQYVVLEHCATWHPLFGVSKYVKALVRLLAHQKSVVYIALVMLTGLTERRTSAAISPCFE